MACFAFPPSPHKDAERMGQPAVPVGLVTALYRGRAHGTLASRLEALGIATDFIPGVLLSKWIEGGLHYGLGSTLAVRREALEKAGGLLALVDQLADDYEMGARVARAGYRVASEHGGGGNQRAGVQVARILRSPVALAANGARRAAWRLCWADLYAWAGVGVAQCAGQRIEPGEPMAVGIELFSAPGAGHDGGRRSAGRSRGVGEPVAACRCATWWRWACGWLALPETRSCGAGNGLG